MKSTDLEDADQLLTKDYLDMKLRAELNALKVDILQQIIATGGGSGDFTLWFLGSMR
jgi:hypothetical protein